MKKKKPASEVAKFVENLKLPNKNELPRIPKHVFGTIPASDLPHVTIRNFIKEEFDKLNQDGKGRVLITAEDLNGLLEIEKEESQEAEWVQKIREYCMQQKIHPTQLIYTHQDMIKVQENLWGKDEEAQQ